MRKAVYSFLNGDLERSYSFYAENATFDDINEASDWVNQHLKEIVNK